MAGRPRRRARVAREALLTRGRRRRTRRNPEDLATTLSLTDWWKSGGAQSTKRVNQRLFSILDRGRGPEVAEDRLNNVLAALFAGSLSGAYLVEGQPPINIPPESTASGWESITRRVGKALKEEVRRTEDIDIRPSALTGRAAQVDASDLTGLEAFDRAHQEDWQHEQTEQGKEDTRRIDLLRSVQVPNYVLSRPARERTVLLLLYFWPLCHTAQRLREAHLIVKKSLQQEAARLKDLKPAVERAKARLWEAEEEYNEAVDDGASPRELAVLDDLIEDARVERGRAEAAVSTGSVERKRILSRRAELESGTSQAHFRKGDALVKALQEVDAEMERRDIQLPPPSRYGVGFTQRQLARVGFPQDEAERYTSNFRLMLATEYEEQEVRQAMGSRKRKHLH